MTETYANALKRANEILVGMGREPVSAFPPGIQSSTASCPLARLFNAAVMGTEEVRFDTRMDALAFAQTVVGVVKNNWTPLPLELTKFIHEFDNSEYPELIDPEEYSY